MKKILLFTALLAALVFTGCSKDNDASFKFGVENLYGTWDGIAIKSKGEWIDITKAPHTNLGFSATFHNDGTYSAEGYFGDGSGTFKAAGDMIYTYVDGKEMYRYQVHYISNGIAEMSMGVAGSDDKIEIRVQRR